MVSVEKKAILDPLDHPARWVRLVLLVEMALRGPRGSPDSRASLVCPASLEIRVSRETVVRRVRRVTREYLADRDHQDKEDWMACLERRETPARRAFLGWLEAWENQAPQESMAYLG